MPRMPVARVIKGVHILIYEYQTFFFHRPEWSRFFGWALGSHLWGKVFPIHLDQTGSKGALKRRYLPDPDRRPQNPYEAHAECRARELRASDVPMMVELADKEKVVATPRGSKLVVATDLAECDDGLADRLKSQPGLDE
ncbi:hypothetical protein BDK51DRAFT_29972 [Blyttiomyces helicus]|uniref:Uncharacterized protein n=1 Tax=Blyttiomyces helicus TaxID=388810 RepID=A0A4V1IQ62_9FUNG|nr:hypothetical protein BDK51DRAFT_29972 [Blyttiomyces helicus]|eukprot:RKO85447.1 hypothetical protein BDK51DRAFT_29972 [Blyttiomyces helicus]